MYPLSLLLFAIIGLSIKNVLLIRQKNDMDNSARTIAQNSIQKMNGLVLQIGIFSFFLGLLSQEIGLMQAFTVIQQVGAISPALLAGGLYTSFIAPVFGLLILLLALISKAVIGYKN